MALHRVSHSHPIKPIAGPQPVAKPATPARGPDVVVRGGNPFDKFAAGATRGAERYLASNASYDARGIGLCRDAAVYTLEACQAQREKIVGTIEQMAREAS